MSSPITEKSGMIFGTNRVGILTLVAALLATGMAVLLLARTSEPTYQGRKITLWIDDQAARKGNFIPSALKQVGPSGLPYVVHNLALNDSSWHSNYSRLQPKL